MIVAEGLTKRFGDTTVVEDVSFEVEPGKVVGFLGHNGAGKTTTLRMLLGQVIPSAGRATILGQPFDQLEEPLRKVGVLFDSGVHPGRTARDHLRVAAAMGGLDADRIPFLLDLVGLSGDASRRCGGFSSGMRQRLGMATALLGDPDVVILDEPATGLDPEGIRWLRSLLRKLADGGRTVLVSSHHLAEVAQTVDEVLVMDRGRLVAQSSLRDLIREAGAEVVVRTPGAEVLADELRGVGISPTSVTADEVRVKDVPASVVSELAVGTGLPVWEVSGREPDLEEAFFELTERGRKETEAAARQGGEDGGGSDDDAPAPPPDPVEQAEGSLTKRLGTHPTRTGSWVVAVTGGAPEVGRTTTALLLADVIAAHTRARAVAVGLSADRGLLRLAAGTEHRSELALGDLLADLPEFDDTARITPYVSSLGSGAKLLAGVPRPEHAKLLKAGQVAELVEFARRSFEVVVLDVGDLEPTALRAVVRAADHVVLVSATGTDPLAASPVFDAIEERRGEPATLVVTRVGPEQVPTTTTPGGPVLIPADRGLIRALDAGDVQLDHAQPATRIALKQLALTVMEGL